MGSVKARFVLSGKRERFTISRRDEQQGPVAGQAIPRHPRPQEVLRGILARTIPEPILARIFFATQFTRYLDHSRYIRFRRWRFYAEAGLARKPVTVHIYTSTLKVEYQDTDLALYTVVWHEDKKHFRWVKEPRHFETPYQSLQQHLWKPDTVEWRPAQRLPDYASRRFHRHQTGYVQPLLLDDEQTGQA